MAEAGKEAEESEEAEVTKEDEEEVAERLFFPVR